jgi:hypothetical protein
MRKALARLGYPCLNEASRSVQDKPSGWNLTTLFNKTSEMLTDHFMTFRTEVMRVWA